MATHIISNLYYLCKKRKENMDEISRLQKENEKYSELISDISKNPEIRNLIIDNLHIEPNDEPRTIKTECISSSSNGETKKSTYEMPNPDASFSPVDDDFEIVSVKNFGNKWRICVDCCRKRKYISPFCYEQAIYTTDWFTL